MKREVRDALVGYLFVSIWIIGFLLLTVYPIVQTIIFSFQNVKYTTTGIETTSVLFANYKQLLTKNLTYLVALKDFAIEVLICVPIIIIFSFIVAILLNQNLKLKGMFRAIYFLPVIIISGPIVNELFAQDVTSLSILGDYGFKTFIQSYLPKWLQDPILSLFDKMIYILWLSGVQIIIFLSGLSKINRSMYEAASIDGANSWVKLWKITLPSIVPMIGINALYTIVSLSTSSTNEVTKIIKLDKDNVQFGYGYASAEAMIYVLVIIVILLVFVLSFYLFTRKEKRLDVKYKNN